MKRILSFVLALLLVGTIIPFGTFTVFAAWSTPAIELTTDYDSTNDTITATLTIGAATDLAALDLKSLV